MVQARPPGGALLLSAESRRRNVWNALCCRSIEVQFLGLAFRARRGGKQSNFVDESEGGR